MKETAFGHGALLFPVERGLEQRISQVRLLSSVARHVGQKELLEHIGNFIYLSFREVFDYDRMALALLDVNGTKVSLRWHRTEDPGLHLASNHDVQFKGTSLERVLASGRPQIISNLGEYFKEHDPSDWTQFISREGIQSNVTCPLIVQGQVVGFLLFSSRHRDAYHEEQVEYYQQIADEISNILATAEDLDHSPGVSCVNELAQSLVRLVNTMESSHNEIALMDTVLQRINAGLGLNEVLDHVYESFSRLIPYSRIGCALLEENGHVLRTRWVRSRSRNLRLGEGYAAPLSSSSLQQIFETGKPRVLNKLDEYLASHPHSDSTRLIVEEGMRSSLTCPLLVQGKPVGVLFFSSMHPHTYHEAHVNTFMRVARQLSIIVEKGRLYQEINEERGRSERLLAELLPPAIAERLKKTNGPIADAFDDVTVLFADIVDFTAWAALLPPEKMVKLLNRIFTQFDELVHAFGMEKISTKGDGYLSVAGVPVPQSGTAVAAAKLALALRRTARKFTAPQGGPITLRIGLNSGPIIAGTVGTRAYHYDVWGRTVNLASRMQSLSDVDRIQVSQNTYEKLRGNFRLQERGTIQVKGFGEQRTWWLLGAAGKKSG